MSEHTFFWFYESPIGTLLLQSQNGKLTKLVFPEKGQAAPAPTEAQKDRAPFEKAMKQLDEYFAGSRKNFELELTLKGTDFQKSVWTSLTDIPYGQTVCYSHIAKEIGRPKAVRAVGAANGKNPIPIIIPCHRVIGKDGSLTGFGGGLAIKRALLKLEKVGKS